MTFFKFLLLGVASLSFAGCCCTQQSCLIAQKPGIKMGGVPGWLAAGPRISSEPAPMAPDPCIVPFERRGGPVEFEMPLEKCFKPSEKPFRPFCDKPKSNCDPIPCAIEREMDRCRSARISRLVQ